MQTSNTNMTGCNGSEDAHLKIIRVLGVIRQQIGGPGTRPLGDQMAEMVRQGNLSRAEVIHCLRRGILADLRGLEGGQS